MTEGERWSAARQLGDELFVKPGRTAVLDLAQLKAIVDAMDDWEDLQQVSRDDALPADIKAPLSEDDKALVVAIIGRQRSPARIATRTA